MSTAKQGIKVINIDEKVYAILKEYCEREGYKIAKFVERLITERIRNENRKKM
jgi:hypothetical protein